MNYDLVTLSIWLLELREVIDLFVTISVDD